MLIGVKLHRALYPKRHTLLAASLGINVNIASENSTIANIMCVGVVLFVIFVSLCIVIDVLMKSLLGA